MEILTSKALRIHGRVQGVGFRESMRREAVRLGLVGWVRNNRDGTVEAWVHGKQENVETLIAWTRQGPSFASVERVEISASTEVATMADFIIRHD